CAREGAYYSNYGFDYW
nr:immunoglobulin heavy chain junction region [Mus musculus]